MDEYQLLTSTRYDPTLTRLSWNDDSDGPSPYFLLPYHYERLQNAVKHHGWVINEHLGYTQFKKAIDGVVSKELEGRSKSPPPALRIRILLSKDEALQVTATPLESAFPGDPFLTSETHVTEGTSLGSHPLIKLRIDKMPTTPSIFTTTKTTARSVYDEARTRNDLLPLTTPEGRTTDVLLRNQEGMVMETSIFNVAFLRNSRWYTPASTVGCLPGVARRWLLERGRIVEDAEGLLTVETIVEGESVLLFNGVQGCRVGIIANLKES